MNIRADSSALGLSYAPPSNAATSGDASHQTRPRTLPATKPSRLLVPINIRKCPLEVFSFIREISAPGTSVVLFHGVDPEPVRSVPIEQAVNSAKEHLDRLANRFVPSAISVSTAVCVGKPGAEILAHAKKCRAELIVLSSYSARAIASEGVRTGIIGQVLKSPPCNVSLLQVRTHFDCEKQWDLVEDIVAALNYVGLLKAVNRWHLLVR